MRLTLASSAPTARVGRSPQLVGTRGPVARCAEPAAQLGPVADGAAPRPLDALAAGTGRAQPLEGGVGRRRPLDDQRARAARAGPGPAGSSPVWRVTLSTIVSR